MRPGGEAGCGAIIGVDLERAREKTQSQIVVVRRHKANGAERLQIKLVSADAVRPGPARAYNFRVLHAIEHGAKNLQSHPVLQIEGLVELSLQSLCPEQPSIGRRKSDHETEPIAGNSDASCQHIVRRAAGVCSRVTNRNGVDVYQ